MNTHYEPKFTIDGLARWQLTRAHHTQAIFWTLARFTVLIFGLITGMVCGIILKKSIGAEFFDDHESLVRDSENANGDNLNNSFNLGNLESQQAARFE